MKGRLQKRKENTEEFLHFYVRWNFHRIYNVEEIFNEWYKSFATFTHLIRFDRGELKFKLKDRDEFAKEEVSLTKKQLVFKDRGAEATLINYYGAKLYGFIKRDIQDNKIKWWKFEKTLWSIKKIISRQYNDNFVIEYLGFHLECILDKWSSSILKLIVNYLSSHLIIF